MSQSFHCYCPKRSRPNTARIPATSPSASHRHHIDLFSFSKNLTHKIFNPLFKKMYTVVRQHSRYVHSGRTANVEFPRILAASVHTPYRCYIILRNCLKATRDNITDRLLIFLLFVIVTGLPIREKNRVEIEGCFSNLAGLISGAVCRLDCVEQSARVLLKNKNPKHQTTRRHLSIKQSCSSINLYKTDKQIRRKQKHAQAGRQAGRQTDRQTSKNVGIGGRPLAAASRQRPVSVRTSLPIEQPAAASAAGRPTGRTDGRPQSAAVELERCARRRPRMRLGLGLRALVTTRVANCARENVGRRLTGREITPAEPWLDRAGQQQMVILADFLMPWRLCRKFRRRPLLPWSLVDGRCATRTLHPSSNLGVAVDDSAAAVEYELNRVRTSVELMLNRMDESPDEALPNCSEEECVVCLSGKASLQTFPCGHMVLCRRCFVKTIQVALDERQLPLRCIICRSRIVRLKQQISSRCRVTVRTEPVPMFSSEFESSSTPSSAIRRPGYC
ncbi:hypothetical protein T07_330 [Trichinella nelsoni]|uniref:RING-type domain-containing protein n=1 Tax=Trichinella nelsoni TaxID=6336 RepID=A0A0V0SGT8_9BILA|nr:hypothetical protein T07_330 [Trichinella nelsoni]